MIPARTASKITVSKEIPEESWSHCLLAFSSFLPFTDYQGIIFGEAFCEAVAKPSLNVSETLVQALGGLQSAAVKSLKEMCEKTRRDASARLKNISLNCIRTSTYTKV